MTYENFEYFYPMPDDIAQTILMAETEPEIHLRPLGINNKKIWLYNKILKNLLTGRKTVIVTFTASDIKLLEEFLYHHDLESLCFFFQHSRSNIEKSLKEFQPIIVSGKLAHEQYDTHLKFLRDTFDELKKSHHAMFAGNTSKRLHLVSLLLQCMKLRSALGEYLGLFISPCSRFSYKEYVSFKGKMDDIISLSAGFDLALKPFEIIKKDVIRMFSPEEAWNIIDSNIGQTLQLIQGIMLEVSNANHRKFQVELIGLQRRLIYLHGKITNLIQREERTAEDDLQLDLYCQKWNDFLGEYKISGYTTRSEISTADIASLLSLASDALKEKMSTSLIEVNELSAQEFITNSFFDKYFLFQAKSLFNLPEITKENSDASLTTLRNLYNHLITLRKLKSYFEKYYQWQSYFDSCALKEQEFLIQCRQIPPDKWGLLVDLKYVEDIIGGMPLCEIEENETRTEQFLEAIEKYKSIVNPEIRSRTESNQHFAIARLSQLDEELQKLLILHKNSDYTLAEYYSLLPQFSEIFPIIVLENVKEDYLPNVEKMCWDEAIYIGSEISTAFQEKLEKSSRRRIFISTELSHYTDLSIALMQAPPEGIEHLVAGETTRNSQTIKGLSEYIFANFAQPIALINNEEFVLSFMPEDITAYAARLNHPQYNIFRLSEQSDVLRLQDWLNYPNTRKVIWTLDAILEPNHLTIQHLGWQMHFILSLRHAGFEVKTFRTKELLEHYYLWPYPDQRLFENRLQKVNF